MPNGVAFTERGKIAVEVVNWLLSEMTVNNAYESNGKPIYDYLTRDHIDWVIAEFDGEHERSDVQP